MCDGGRGAPGGGGGQEPRSGGERRGGECGPTAPYRSVILIALTMFIMVVALWALLWRESFDSVLAKIAGSGETKTKVQEAPHARFVNLDGTVRVKKRDSVQWINGDYGTSLEVGDIVQTGSNGIEIGRA